MSTRTVEYYQTTFARGEISPAILNRYDAAAYYQGASVMRNFITTPTGGLQRRGGTRHAGATTDSSRLVSIRLGSGTAIVMEMVAGEVRFWVPSGDGATRLQDTGVDIVLATPYNGTELWDVQYAVAQPFDSDATQVWLTHPNYPVQLVTLTPIYDGTPQDVLSEPIADASFNNQIPPGGIGVPDLVGWSPVAYSPGDEPSWTTIQFQADLEATNPNWTDIQILVFEEVPANDVALRFRSPTARHYRYDIRYRIILEPAQFTIIGTTAAISQPTLLEFSSPGRYPSCVAIHEQRLALAATNQRPATPKFATTTSLPTPQESWMLRTRSSWISRRRTAAASNGCCLETRYSSGPRLRNGTWPESPDSWTQGSADLSPVDSRVLVRRAFRRGM